MLPDTTPPDCRDEDLFEGMVVRHRNRHAGFGVNRGDGVIKSFIVLECGTKRALVHWKDDDTEQYVDVDKLEGDLIGTLGHLTKEAGLTMTLFGQPVDTEQLRAAATSSAMERIENAIDPNGLRLGQIVHLRGFKKGDDKAHVVVSEPSAGRVKLAYAGSERFFAAKWYAVEFVIREVNEENPHVKRARRLFAKETTVGADGWKRIVCGARYGGIGEAETVGHVEVSDG